MTTPAGLAGARSGSVFKIFTQTLHTAAFSGLTVSSEVKPQIYCVITSFGPTDKPRHPVITGFRV